MSASTFRGHRPTGQASWPMVVIAGADHTGKSYTTAEFTGSDLIGETFWIEYGEKTAEEYGNVPGARYIIADHDGSYQGVLQAARDAVAEPRRNGKPNCIVIDSVSVIWETLSAEMQAIANRRKKVSPDDESQITADLWNLARDRWKKLIKILRLHDGPVILLARLEIVAVMDAKGQPTTAKTRKIVAHKSLPYDVDVIVQIPEYRRYQLTGVRSLKLQMPVGETFDVPPDFTLDALMRNLGLDEPGAAGPRVFIEPQPNADDALADTGGPQPVVTDAAWLAGIRLDIIGAPNIAALNAIGDRINAEAIAGRLAVDDGENLRRMFDDRMDFLRAEAVPGRPDQPAAPTAPDPEFPAAPPAMPSGGQLTNLAIQFKERHITDADRLRCTSQLLSREVPSFSTLTLNEYRMVKSALRGGWPYINHVPQVLPDVPEEFEDNPVRDILVSVIANAVSPETLRAAGADIAKELARDGITRAEGVYLRTVYQARTAQLQARVSSAPVLEPGPPPVGTPDNPGIADYQRRMLDGVAARQQHTPAALVGLAQQRIRGDITSLDDLSKDEAERFLRMLTTGEKPAMAGAA